MSVTTWARTAVSAVVLAAALSGAPWAQAQQSPKSPSADPIIIPILKDGSIRPAHGREELSTALQVLLLLTLLTLAAVISAITTCFTRIVVMPVLVVPTAAALSVAAGRPPVLLCAAEIRAQLRRMTKPLMSRLVVSSYNEVSDDVRIESAGFVSLDSAQTVSTS